VTRLLAGKTYTAERRYLHADGHSLPVHVSTAVLHDDEGQVARLVGFVVDMSEAYAQRNAVEAELAAAKAELDHRHAFTEALLDNLDVGVVSIDASGNSIVRNRAARAMLGPVADASIGGRGFDLADAVLILSEGGRPMSSDQLPLMRVLRGEELHGLDLQVRPADGPMRDVMVNGHRMRTPDGAVLGSRRRGDRRQRRAGRHPRARRGTPAPDRCRAARGPGQRTVRGDPERDTGLDLRDRHDTLARVGGDEFVIIIEPWHRQDRAATDRPTAADDRDVATAVADRIGATLRRPILVDGTEHLVSASIGITHAGSSRRGGQLTTPSALLQEADAAMYRAKHLGKDRFEIFENGLRTDLVERGRVEQVLRGPWPTAPRPPAHCPCPVTRPPGPSWPV